MALSGQKTVTAAGTALPLSTQYANCAVLVKALDTNTGVVVVGNDGAGDVTTSNGLRLLAGDVVIFDFVGYMGTIIVDAAVNGEGVSWVLLTV